MRRDFGGNIEDWQSLFEAKTQLWNGSITCGSFKRKLAEMLPGRRMTKIICFGLGEMARQPPPTTLLPGQNGANVEVLSHSAARPPAMIQHAAALTLAEEVRRHCDGEVRLLAQDPQYSDDTKQCLQAKGFEVVGEFGGDGFAHIDDECTVFSAWPSAPIKQIIADIALPVALIMVSDQCDSFNRFK